MPNYKEFETERLLLRPTKGEDADFVLRLLNTPKWLKFIGDRKVRTLEDAKNYIATKMEPQLKRLGYSNYTVLRKMDGAKMGSCGLYDREGVDGVDIGFAFLPEYEGQGYGYEASKTLKKAAFQEFGLTAISAITVKENRASQKLLEKLGLQVVGTTVLPDSNEELLLYKVEISK